MKKIGLTIYGLDVHRIGSYSIDNAEENLDFISIVDCFASATLNGFDIDANSENIFKFESVEREKVKMCIRDRSEAGQPGLLPGRGEKKRIPFFFKSRNIRIPVRKMV